MATFKVGDRVRFKNPQKVQTDCRLSVKDNREEFIIHSVRKKATVAASRDLLLNGDPPSKSNEEGWYFYLSDIEHVEEEKWPISK